jgi:putative FmdB family regulatory protein
MPIYECKCKVCKRETDYMSSIANRDNTPKCLCGGDMERVILTPPACYVDNPAFMSKYKAIHSNGGY